MKSVSCFTCMGRTNFCSYGNCYNYGQMPKELLCSQCIIDRPGQAAPLSIVCGLDFHPKPALEDVIKAWENWVPNLDIQKLAGTMVINHAMVGSNNTCLDFPFDPTLLRPPMKTSPVTLTPSNTFFDPTTGQSRVLTAKDKVVSPSQEKA